MLKVKDCRNMFIPQQSQHLMYKCHCNFMTPLHCDDATSKLTLHKGDSTIAIQIMMPMLKHTT